MLPWVDPVWRDEFLATCKFDIHTIDNSERNRGVPRSWNMGIDRMRKDDSDWLVVVSCAIRFGDEGGEDFLRILEQRPDHRAVSALGTFGWHLIAFSRETVETAGRFDENLWPGYLEDIDWAIRMYRVKPDAPWGAYACDVTDAGMAHSIAMGVEVSNGVILTYFHRKWGRPPGGEWDEYHARPFGDNNNPITFWPMSPYTGGVFDQPAPEEI